MLWDLQKRVELQNHSIGNDFKDHLVQSLHKCRRHYSYTIPNKYLQSLFLKTSREADSTISLGSLFHFCPVLAVRKLFVLFFPLGFKSTLLHFKPIAFCPVLCGNRENLFSLSFMSIVVVSPYKLLYSRLTRLNFANFSSYGCIPTCIIFIICLWVFLVSLHPF